MKKIYSSNHKIVRCILSLIMTIICVITVYPLKAKEQVPTLLRALYYIITFISGFYYVDNRITLKHTFNNLWKKGILLILELYAVFAFVGLYFLDMNIKYEYNLPKILYLFLSWLWVRVIIYEIIAWLLIPKERAERKTTASLSGKWKIIIFWQF